MYVLGQYNKNVTVHDDDTYMTLITAGTPDRKASSDDTEVTGTFIFEDECIKVANFSISKYYYFHGKIKRMTSDQIFYIKLIEFDSDEKEQYIKTITVSKGDINEWVDVEFVFAPLSENFDCILFELQRNSSDYKIGARYPKIAYEELSEINNIITSKIASGVNLVKLGVQSRPGLLMCINGEEIRTCRTGVYELKNGIMTVSFFSVVNAVKEVEIDPVTHSTALSVWINNINEQIEEINEKEESGEIDPEEAERQRAAINSECFFGNEKQARRIDSFTLDYMYYKED